LFGLVVAPVSPFAASAVKSEDKFHPGAVPDVPKVYDGVVDVTLLLLE